MLLGRHPRVPGKLGVRDNKDPMKCGQAQWSKKNKEKEGRNEKVVLNWVPLNLEPGLCIMLQCPRTKRYNIPGKVIQVREGGRSAWVDVGGGKT